MSTPGSTISGELFLDLNADGIADGSDAGLAGETVTLLSSAGVTVATTTTDANGNYSFTGVAAGSYYVQATAPSGASFSPTNTGAGGSVVSSTGKSPLITVSSGVNATAENAGVYVPVTYSGTVFTDSNDDGLVDGADMGKGGVTVQLLNAAGNPTGQTTTTASNGTYSFTGLLPGTYSVHVVLPTTPTGAMFSPYGSNTTPQPTGGTITAEQNLLTNGSFEPANTFSTAQGYAGWTLSTNTAATPYGSGPGDGPEIALTNGGGAIAIDPQGNTNPYAGYVSADNANPYYAGGSGAFAAFFVDDGAIESISQTVTLTAGQTYEIGFDLNETTPGENNPGFFQLSASIGGQTITTAGSTSGTRLTPGTWTHFADLYTPTTTGAVTLTFQYQSGVPGSTLQSKDVLVDDVYIVPGQVTQNLTTTSEVNSGGYTTPVTLTSGQSVGNESAGIYYPPATISGTVFADANADGVQQAADAGMAGRTVNLSSNGVIVATTVTAADGTYSFTNQAAGTYTVTVVAPSGDKFSAAGTSTALPDSTVSTGGTQTVTVANGATATVNAGLYVPVSLGGTVFTDANGDGAKQSTESGLSGTTVKLLGSTGAVVATTTTASNGTYSFTGETPGTYTVQVVPPTGDGVSPAGTSTTLTDSTVGATGAQTVTVNSAGSATINAGLYVPSTVSGTVFTDANADGAQQATDAGLGGQTVNLVNASGTVIATTTTASNGTYSFTGVAPGSDTIQVIAPTGDKFSPTGTSATLTDSTVSSTGAGAVTITSGSASTVNAGVYAPAAVTGTVFTDVNDDGVQETGDTGVSGQTVKLTSASGAVLTTTTGSNGAYSFTGLTPGSYTVQTTAPAGDSFSPTGSSTTLPDSTVSAAGAASVTLTSGATGTVNAGEYAPSTITGTVFTDANADGAQQATDSGLGGQTVNLLNAAGTVIGTTTTASNGTYSFTGVAPGSDTIQVTAPTGDKFSPTGTSATLPDSTVSGTGSSAVTITSGSTSTVNAGVYVPASVTGTVFTDVNDDGVQETGDTGVSGQTVKLTSASGAVLTTTTASNGTYSFAGLTPGSYTLQTTAPAGDSFSPTGSSTTLPDSGVSSTGAASITLTSGAKGVVNAGEYAPSTITGTVFTDANADGAQETGDAALGGQTINLLNAAGTVIATTTTAANGTYSFTGVAPGADTIQVVAPAGSKFSPAGTSATLTDSTVSATGSSAVTVTSGSATTVNAGEYAPSTITGTVFTDANADGAQETGDAALGGQTINLLNAAGTVIATTTTAANGTYSFTGVAPGADTIQVVAPAGSKFSPAGTSATLTDSTVSATGSSAVTVTSGSATTVNAGEYAPSTITGTVFTDANADGAQQATDTGLAGQTVNLLNSTGAVIATTTTASNGTYNFTGVAPGNDTIQVIAPTGDKFSPTGTSTTLPDSTVSATGNAAVTVTSGSSTAVNAGLYAPASVTGTIFTDSNADGVKETGDTGTAGQTVKLTSASGAVLTTTTASNGAYSFTGLTPGSYTVQTTAPAGDSFSPTGSSTTLPDSTVSATGAAAVTLTSGATATVNAGEYAPSTITGTVFTDANADGAQQSTDAGLGGQTVNLLNAAGTVIGTTTTAANGTYSFTGVAPGSDTVQVTAPTGDKFSPTGTSTTLPDSTVSGTGSSAVTITSGSTSTVNAGVYVPASVTGTVFTDVNDDGVQETGDTGVSGQTVKLTSASGAVLTTTTASNGTYSFAGLTPGSYTVQTTAPAGDSFSPTGSSTTLPDSTVSATGAASVTLTSGATATVNAGEYAPSSISGTVFTDANADGVKETGDTGLGGQTVNLINASGTVIATTTTAANGTYSFTGIAPGSDTIQVTAPTGDKFSPTGASTTLPDSSVSATGASAVTIVSGSSATVNAGLYAPATVTGTVFTDANGDGIQQAGDAGLGGQTVTLLAANGATIATTTTSPNGSYSFTGVTPGNDTVTVTPATGDRFSTAGNGTQAVTLTSGSSAAVNAGEYAPASLTGTVFTDQNADGVKEANDAGLSGVKVSLLDATGKTIATTVSDANGVYSFTNLAPGQYAAKIALPSGLQASPTGASTTLPDSTVSSTGMTPAVTLTSGQSVAQYSGLYAPATLNGTVFTDANGDGVQETTEGGFGGLTVQLLDASGKPIAGQTAITAADGSYSFTGLPPGSYAVSVALPNGDSISPLGASTTRPDNVANSAGVTPTVTLASGQTASQIIGGYAPSIINGTVFNDANADGAQEQSDAGLAGKTVSLLNAAGTVIATTATAANGSYSFAGVAPGADTIQVVAPAGDAFSPDGTSTTLTDSGVSSNGTAAVTVTSGSSTTVNAGLFAPATVTGTVFTDVNGDGVQEPGDTSLAGQKVNLIAADGHSIIATTATAADGSYSFTGVAPGTYGVQIVPAVGNDFSPAGGSTTLTDSTVPARGLQSVVLNSGVTTIVNAGEYAPSTITGTVFTDTNADGVQEPGEPGLAGQTVNLLNAAGTVIATTATAANGTYSFTGIAPGSDTIQVAPLAGDKFSPTGASTTAPDSTVSAAGTAPVTVTTGSASTVNAGEFASANIGGTIFADSNANGVQDPGELGLPGQTVELIGPDGHTIAATETTDANGNYDFASLTPGSYTVEILAPSGTLFSPTGSSTDAQSITVGGGASATVNAGEYMLATVTGTVFNDANADGAQQAGDTGLSGVTVDLLDGTTIVATATTNAQGGYSFTGITPGADTVQVIAPAGEDFSPKGTSTTLLDSTVSATGSQTLTLTSGAALQANAGLYAPATITGDAFLDAHYDGLDDLGDPAFSGVTVKLYDGAGNFTGQTTVTNATGGYSFTNLAPGQYQVQFVAPAGTVFTQEHAGSNPLLDSDANPVTGRSEIFTLMEGQTDLTHNAGLLLTGGYANPGTIVGSGGLDGGTGDNIIIGGPGSNTIEGGTGTNLIVGGSGPYAQIQGLGTNDIIYGGPGDDLIQGHAGNEFIAAGVGNQTLVGGGGGNTFIANANRGTITDTNGVFSGISGGDTFITHGNTDSIYQAGDGVLTIEDYDAAAGDTLQVYGYTAPTAVGQANGFDVLYFGANAAILVRANNTTVSAAGIPAGITFAATAPTAPLSTVGITPANYLTLTEAGASAPIIGPGTAPTITGAAAGQAVADNASITPFSGLVVADPTPGQMETVTVTPFAQDGSFSRLGSGSVTNGVYTVTGTPQTVTAALEALTFNPTFHQVTAGQTVTTGFTVTATDTAGYSRTDATTSVIATATDEAPTITGAIANQAASGSVSPFSSVVIGDPDGGLTETVSVKLSNPAGGTLSNLGNGSYNAATGVYTTIGTAAATTANLDQVVFTPASTGTTGFAITVTDSAGGTATNTAASVIATQAPLPVPTPAPGSAATGYGDASQTITLTGWNNTVTVGNGNDTINAGYGNATVVAGNGNDTITAGGYGNRVTVGTGNNTIDVGSNVQISAAGGNQTITLNGYSNLVFIGGSGSSAITGGLGNDQITTVGGNTSIALSGYGNMVTTGGASDTISDGAGGTHFLVGPTQPGLSGGAEIITNFQPTSLVDLINGAAGSMSLSQVYNSLTAVSGGTKLDLGTGGSVTFLGLAPSQLHTANFQIG